MRNASLARRAAILAASVLTLSGCVHASRPGTPPLAVAIPDTCERVLEPVPLPPVRADDDARVAWSRSDAALQTANGRIVAGRHCLADQRNAYSGPELHSAGHALHEPTTGRAP